MGSSFDLKTKFVEFTRTIMLNVALSYTVRGDYEGGNDRLAFVMSLALEVKPECVPLDYVQASRELINAAIRMYQSDETAKIPSWYRPESTGPIGAMMKEGQ